MPRKIRGVTRGEVPGRVLVAHLHRVVDVVHEVGEHDGQPYLCMDYIEGLSLRAQAGTIAVLNSQLSEILTTDFDAELKKHNTPCYFAMSVRDPLLSFETTHSILQNHFTSLSTVRLDYPFHQPPAPFTYEELNHDFHATVDSFICPKDEQGVSHVQQKNNERDFDRVGVGRDLGLPPAIDRIPALVQ